MKRFLALAFTAAILVSCNKDGYTIHGEAKGFADGTKVYMNKQDENGFTKLDSTVVSSGTFEFKNSETPELDLYFIELDTTKMHMYPLVLETGEINFSFDKENPQDTKVTGTKNNDLMTSYNKEAFKIQKEII